jgi:hypothetical protein
LFLVLCILGDNKCEAIIDATLSKELLKLLLEVKIESLKLVRARFECPRSTVIKKENRNRT